MACVPAVKNLVNLQMDNYEHIITNTSTPLQRLGSIVRGQVGLKNFRSLRAVESGVGLMVPNRA